MSEEMIPIVMFVGISVVLCALIWFRYRSRNDVQTTIRAALDKGRDLSPELIDRLGHPKSSKDKDLRLGTIWLSIAAGLVLMGIAIPDPEAFRGLLTGAAFPLCIGVAYLILHKITDRD